MHKCFKCGAEFEGNFCPECGTQWQENKQCPNCGATLAGGAKFCNNCGYSFVESAEEKKPAKEKKPSKVGAFFKKAWAWVRSHLKIVIPTACALIVVIVVCSLIPTFILMSVNGSYYAYSFDENGEIVFNEKTYITLSTGKWTDEEGKEGSYSLSGGEITFTYIDETMEDLGDLFGEDVGPEELKGTVENGLLTINENGFNRLFVLKSHKHKFGEWEVTKEPTCTEEGDQRHTCACRKVETEAVAPTGHNLIEGKCNNCNFTQLKYELNEEGTAYVVTGFNEGIEKTDTAYILAEYEGKPVTSIGDYAFSGCSGLTGITIPDSVTSIGSNAFYDCSGLIQTENGVRYVNKWIVGCDREATSVTLRSDSVGIGAQAFRNCRGLTSVTIPNSITSIGDSAFAGCSGLTSITIPNSITSIGDSAFSGCSGLTSITIPNSVTSIGNRAFDGCSGLTSIYYEGDIADWCRLNGYLDNSKVYIKNQKLHEITNITIPDGVTSIGDCAFAGCSELTSITIGNSVTSIGISAFAGCSGLTSVTIPDSVTSIGNSAFNGCSGLTSVTIGNSVTSIGNYTFAGCNKVESVKIPVTAISYIPTSSLKTVVITGGESIGSYAFAHCSKLTSITIPNSVTSIGVNAFLGCSGLTSIVFNGTKTQWKAIEKGNHWSFDTGNYTVQCTDGKLDKNGNEIE